MRCSISASLASPKDYLAHPIETLDVGSLGTRSMLDLARAKDARFLLTSTSECYGDPPCIRRWKPIGAM